MPDDRPVAIGPTSRTVIGAGAKPAPASGKLPTVPAKKKWPRWVVPVGLAGAVYLALRAKGHV